jgi:hypothetical protein
MATVYNTKLPPPLSLSLYKRCTFNASLKILTSPPCHFTCCSKLCCQGTTRHKYFSYLHGATILIAREKIFFFEKLAVSTKLYHCVKNFTKIKEAKYGGRD